MEVKRMQVLEKANRSSSSCCSKSERGRSAKADYYPELRTWVQHAIMEAEKSKNYAKKDQLLDLLNDL
jgi:hypothetical protein